MAGLQIEELNTIETSVETWLDFIDFSMKSDFYRVALNRTRSVEQAAALTLLDSYMSTFEPLARERAVRDAEVFYEYANGFINELAPYRYHEKGYKSPIRASFMGKIKSLLRGQKKGPSVVDQERYTFIRTIVKFCSSLNYIIKVHDEYKKFLFRELPQAR